MQDIQPITTEKKQLININKTSHNNITTIPLKNIKLIKYKIKKKKKKNIKRNKINKK